jgi:anti-sigma-K factor RskA
VSCSLQSKPDWNAYALGELDSSARRYAESHAASCGECREELATLRLTLDVMSTLKDEEIPRRIAFVSDKVFERRWWQQLWNPTFAAACVIAAAILVHAFVRPMESSPAVSQAQIDAAVTKAVAEVEARHAQQLVDVLADYEIFQKQARQMYKTTSGIVSQ